MSTYLMQEQCTKDGSQIYVLVKDPDHSIKYVLQHPYHMEAFVVCNKQLNNLEIERVEILQS